VSDLARRFSTRSTNPLLEPSRNALAPSCRTATTLAVTSGGWRPSRRCSTARERASEQNGRIEADGGLGTPAPSCQSCVRCPEDPPWCSGRWSWQGAGAARKEATRPPSQRSSSHSGSLVEIARRVTLTFSSSPNHRRRPFWHLPIRLPPSYAATGREGSGSQTGSQGRSTSVRTKRNGWRSGSTP